MAREKKQAPVNADKRLGAEMPPPPFEVTQEEKPDRLKLTVESITGTVDLREKLERSRHLRAASLEAKAVVQIHSNQESEEACQVPSVEALEIQGVIAVCKVKRMLLDTGSSMDVLFKSTFERMQLAPEMVYPSSSVLIGFSGAPAQVIGRVRLPVTLGDEVHRVTHAVEFGIVDRPLLALFNGVTSTCHQTLKFIAPQGIGISRGESIPRYALEDEAKGTTRRHKVNNVDVWPDEGPRVEAMDEELAIAIDEERPD
ncbi:unnamed protein product [Linum trigynum]|uniref:Peptidase A2 domain-containing protein n=1 Tax=Linum trigynum TaxID=586398 RepID=A0AAV2CFE2_9ROSI